MPEDITQSSEEFFIEDYISNPTADQILNLDCADGFFEDTINSPNVPSTANDDPYTSVVAAVAESSPAANSITALPCYDTSVASTYSPYDSSDFLSALLNPQPPPELEPDILTSFSGVPMAPIYPTNQLNQMISPGAYPSCSPDSMVSQIPLDLPPYLSLEPSTLRPCSYIEPNGGIGGESYADRMGVPTCGADGQFGLFADAGMAVRPLEAMETCGIGIYAPGSMQRAYTLRDLQELGDNQHMMIGCSGSTAPLQMTSDIPILEDSSYKVGRLSPEERKEKIERYIKKRNERNFKKKIKYACRKYLADSRLRVRGRFAKNDELNEAAPGPDTANHEDDEEEGMEVKNEEDLTQIPAILAHISGLNSFNNYYPFEP